jgi:tight adherence protein C
MELVDSDIIAIFEEKKEERKGVVKFLLSLSQIVGDFFASIFISPLDDARTSKYGLYKKISMKIDRMLVIAGRPLGIVPNEIVGCMIICLLISIPISIFLGNFFNQIALASMVLIPIAFLMPLIWLNDIRKKRQVNIFRALPYAIDLMTLSVEAGMDFTVALRKISEKLGKKNLGEEFIQVVSQISLGKSRSEALKDMANRVQIDDLLSFANSIIQADELGSSMGPVLRIQSSQLRIKRSQIAEEKAMKAPVKLIFPLVLFFLPAVLLMLGGIIFVSKILPMLKN